MLILETLKDLETAREASLAKVYSLDLILTGAGCLAINNFVL